MPRDTLSQDHLTVRAPAPDWYHWAMGCARESRFAEVDGCPVHYLLWLGNSEAARRRGILFVHGGGAHAHWWSFLAPFFMGSFQVAAIDLSGMGDSGARQTYGAAVRADDMRGVIADAGLGPETYVVGHSFGGFMTMKFGAVYGDEIAGAVIVDTPLRPPGQELRRRSPRMGELRLYDSFEAALARFRLLPAQDCVNPFLVEHIARHSIKPVDGGWTWKFDPGAMAGGRFKEPFADYMAAMTCRTALIHGENSAIVTDETVAYFASLMGPASPLIEIPQGQHHLTLDQPLAFVAALRALLETWCRAA